MRSSATSHSRTLSRTKAINPEGDEQMEKKELKPGDVMQLDPYNTKNKAFSACFFVVTEPKAFGAQGYVQALGKTRDETGGLAYYRADWEEMDGPIGTAIWMPPDDETTP